VSNMTLANAPFNKRLVISSVENLQLSEIGFIPGAIVRIIAKAPFKGPIAVRVDSSTFAIRLEEAAQVNINDCEDIAT